MPLSVDGISGKSQYSFCEKEGFTRESNGDFYGHPVVFMLMKKYLLKSS